VDERSEIRKGIFYVLQDVRLGELTEYEATLKLQELGAVIKVEGELHPLNELGSDVDANFGQEVCCNILPKYIPNASEVAGEC